MMISLIVITLFIWNVFVLLVYGFDKLKAKRQQRRIRERTLLTLSFLFGGIGSMFAMIFFNHKTAKMKFRVLVPLYVIINVVVIYVLFAKGITL